MRRLVAFIQARTWTKSQRMIETQPELLSADADVLLEQLAAAQQDAGVRTTIERHRTLLAHCREVGVAVAFAEIHQEQPQQPADDTSQDLNMLLTHAVAILRTGTVEQRAELAGQLELMAARNQAMPGLGQFLTLIADWVRGTDVTEPAMQLIPEFRDAYERMAHLVAAADEPEDGMKQILQQVYTLLVGGTALQRRTFADQLVDLTTQIPAKQIAFKVFLDALVAALRGEDVDAAALDEQFLSMWDDLHAAVVNAAAPRED